MTIVFIIATVISIFVGFFTFALVIQKAKKLDEEGKRPEEDELQTPGIGCIISVFFGALALALLLVMLCN